jgi:hypothetical protein
MIQDGGQKQAKAIHDESLEWVNLVAISPIGATDSLAAGRSCMSTALRLLFAAITPHLFTYSTVAVDKTLAAHLCATVVVK